MTWEGMPPYRTLVIAQGRIELLADGEGLLRTRASEIKIRFFEGIRPPGVVSGTSICVVGRLWSANLGRFYSMHDCILMTRKGMRLSLMKTLKKYSVAPSTYMDLPEAFRKK
jgi:hypothetical protein